MGGSVGGGWSRGGRSLKSSVVASAITRTAFSKATSVFLEAALTPLTFRTYWRAADSISSVDAVG